jgi:hypothetical protein
MCTIHAKVRAYKSPHKKLQNASKNHQTPTKSEKLGHFAFECLDNMQNKIGKFERSAVFCIVLTELSLWKK